MFIETLGKVLLLIINFFVFAIFAQVILSWLISFGIRHEFVISLYRAISSFTEPLMRPIRKVVPPIGMIDITPMVAMIFLVGLQQIIYAIL